MNKTYSDQIQKATTLSEGIKRNDAVLKQKNINLNMERIDEVAKALEAAANEQEAAEQELTERRNVARELLAELKELYNAAKLPVKNSFPLEQWSTFGICDKR